MRKQTVKCPDCDGKFDAEQVEFVNIQEDMTGLDVSTFVCPVCKLEYRLDKRNLIYYLTSIKFTKYYALYPSPYGLSVKYLGEFHSFDGASDEADEILTGNEQAIWILPEEELVGLSGSIQNMLKNP
jgi:hypothetical protein